MLNVHTPPAAWARTHATYTMPASASTDPVNVYRKNLIAAALRLLEP